MQVLKLCVDLVGGGKLVTGCASNAIGNRTFSQTSGSNFNPLVKQHRKVERPYRISEQQFYGREQPHGEETGLAAWYGRKFDGQPTANGERFNNHLLTTAHPTLPLPSYVRVTNLENGRSLKLRVNDRGPYHSGHIVNVSERAAHILGFRQQGVAEVRVRYLGPAPIKNHHALANSGRPSS